MLGFRERYLCRERSTSAKGTILQHKTEQQLHTTSCPVAPALHVIVGGGTLQQQQSGVL